MKGFAKNLIVAGFVGLIGLASQPAGAYWWGYPYAGFTTYRLVPVIPAPPAVTVKPIALRPVVLKPVTLQPVTVKPLTVPRVTFRPVTVKPLVVQRLTLQPLVATTGAK